MLFFLAISDGILYNDAFKHNHGETNNQSWSGLLRELKFFDEDIDNHPMFLRQRFVLGAAEFMSGKNNSNQDDKTLFGYTDDEWEFIWMTMLADGAWAVPSITDNEGNITTLQRQSQSHLRHWLQF